MELINKEIINKSIGLKSAHASTVEIFNGKPVFAWFEGSREGARDVYIRIKGLFDNDLFIGVNEPVPYWNPILYKHENDLYLWGKVGRFCDCWQTFFIKLPKEHKSENLEDYENFQILPAGLNGPVKSRPLNLGKNIYCGSSTETNYNWTSYIEKYEIINSTLVFYHRSSPIFVYKGGSQGIIQPTLFKFDNKIFALFRSSHGLNKIYMSYSSDGLNWEAPIDTGLDNPNSAIDVAQINDKNYLVWNPSKTLRFPLQLNRFEINESSIKLHEGIIISDEKVENCFTKELSYPYMISENNSLHIVYTKGRKFIEYVEVKI